MSYREGHYFSLEDSKNKKKGQNDFKEIQISDISFEDLAKIWRETLENGMHGVCFSLYEDGQKPGDIISEEQVRRRMKIMAPYTKWVRSFSCTEGNEFIPKITREFGIKTLAGAWLGDDPEINERKLKV